MNRQALAFLTMFSLILMLSVYYVTLPSDTTTVMSTESGEELSDSKTEEEVNDAEQLQSEITSKQEEEIKKHSEVVSSTESTEAEKQEALQTIDELKNDQTMINDLKQACSDAGFTCAIEMKDGTCKINVFDSEDNEDNAKSIMKIANDQLQSKYLIEVTFK